MTFTIRSIKKLKNNLLGKCKFNNCYSVATLSCESCSITYCLMHSSHEKIAVTLKDLERRFRTSESKVCACGCNTLGTKYEPCVEWSSAKGRNAIILKACSARSTKCYECAKK